MEGPASAGPFLWAASGSRLSCRQPGRAADAWIRGTQDRPSEAVSEFARSPNAKTILFPVEATQLIGTLGGIGELTREIIGEGGSRTQAAPKPKGQSSAGRGAPPGVPGVPRIEG